MNTTKTETINKARLNPGRQWIGISNIIRDDRLQPRHGKPDFDWVHDLSGFRKDGSEFPPIRVYQMDDGSLYAAEGFHRIPAMQMAGEDQILCDVVDGTMEEAVIYAAGSNKSNGVRPMGPKDITKAVEMLLAIDKWWNKADSQIAIHVGCGKGKVGVIRSRMSVRDNRPLPATIINRAGKEQPYRTNSRGNPINVKEKIRKRVDKKGRKPHYEVWHKGKYYRSHSEDSLLTKIENDENGGKFKLVLSGLREFLDKHGFLRLGGGLGPNYPGLRGFHRNNFICAVCDFDSSDSLPAAIGQLVAARRYLISQSHAFGPNVHVDVIGKYRVIVLCYPEDGPAKLIDLYKQEGFDFLTPEELVESLKGDQP